MFLIHKDSDSDSSKSEEATSSKTPPAAHMTEERLMLPKDFVGVNDLWE